MGLFTPAWASNDFDKALEAVYKLTDEAKLVRVVNEAPHTAIRLVALRELTNKGTLMGIVNTNSDDTVRLAAAIKVNDPVLMKPVFANIASYCYNEKTALEALDLLEDQNLLADVALREYQLKDVRVAAIKRLTDAQMIVKVIKELNDTYLIGLVLEKVQDEALLLEVFSNSEINRLSIIELIEDQAMLISIARNARNDRDLTIRAAAVAKLKDTDIAQKISKELLDVLNQKLGDKWPTEWRSLEHGPFLLSVINTIGVKSSACPYFDTGVCMFRVMAKGDAISGPDSCSCSDRDHRSCYVWGMSPR